MFTLKNELDRKTMKNYYRASDMIDFWYFFPQASPLLDLAIVTDIDDYLKNREYLDKFDSYRVDTLKPYDLSSGIESDGGKTDFTELFSVIKKRNPHNVLLFFDLEGVPSKRYERLAGLSINVNMYEDVCIEAVGKGFDGREISKGIAVHERYYIPWFDLRNVCVDNFYKYNIFTISDVDYNKSRNERIKYLLSLGIDKDDFIDKIPEKYSKIPSFIWEDLIKNVLSYLEKNEDILIISGYKNFCINGNTEGKVCYLWQMYNKDRYMN